MFSQLCRARPRNKFAIGRQGANAVERRCVVEPEFNGGCRLEHCTFCDYRVCCQVNPESSSVSACDWDEAESGGQVTENPAYGLSSENWLEEDEEEEEEKKEEVKEEDDASGMERTHDPPTSHGPMSHSPKAAEEGVSLLLHKRPFPLSLMRPVSKQQQQLLSSNPVMSRGRTVQRNAPKQRDPLSEMASIRTEESIQEWLARIGEESSSSVWQEEEEEPKEEEAVPPEPEEEVVPCALRGASKASPANVPMVVMQCTRLHSRLLQAQGQSSLPMGALVTALYREADWLYVQTPHGVEGFVASAHCAPIGAANSTPPVATGEQASRSRRPWEPCDFPIGRTETRTKRRVQEIWSERGGVAGMKASTAASFYGERCYPSHTFKSKDLSIKTAKTVTDILRSSPDTKVSNQ